MDVQALARLGYSARAIAELTGRSITQIRTIARRLGLTTIRAKKWSRDLAEQESLYGSIPDIELEVQRGREFRGGYPFEIRPSDYYERREKHGPVRIYRPGPDGELRLVDVVEVE